MLDLFFYSAGTETKISIGTFVRAKLALFIELTKKLRA